MTGKSVRIGWSVAVSVALALVSVAAGDAAARSAIAGASPTAQTASSTGPPAPRWRSIAPAPIDGRISAGVVWTGDEMLVWGGITRGDAIAVNRDGAAYDPVTGTWRRIRNAPAGVRGGGGSAAAWTGELAIFWAGNSPDGPARGAVYDPAGDAWRKLPEGPLGPREGYASAWTGDELLIVGGTLGDGFATPVAAAVTPEGHWRALPALNAMRALIPSGVVWDGDRAYITGLWFHCPELGSSCTDADWVVLAYDPATDALETLDVPTTPLGLRVVGWTGREVAFVTGGTRSRIFLYDPATDAWRSGGRGRCALARGGQQAWLGDRLVQACEGRRLQLYDTRTDAWSVIRAGDSPFNRFTGSAIAWTGRRLIAWSGVAFRRFNPTPNVGARITLRS
jgi:N-acetylneuraminic acid mutarotase